MPDTSFEIRTRTELIDALSVAAQVEHVVLLEYLYAAFSCRGTADSSLPVPVQMTSWAVARDLYAITHDEMDHLGAVQMLLAALGAPPVPDAGPLPLRGGSLPFDVELTRLDAATIDRFVRTESPPPLPPAAVQPPDPIRFDYLGDLYHAVIAALDRLGDAAFLGVGVTSDAPLPLGFTPYDVVPVAKAIESLRAIVTQGEGAVTPTESGHWGRFERMAQRLEALGPAAEGVSWPCVANPSTREGQSNTTQLTAPATVAVADVANRAYRALWLLLGSTYAFDWSTRDAPGAQQLRQSQLGRAMRGARFMMATVVRPLGEILARLPAFADGANAATAGLCFEQYGEFRVASQPDAREQVIGSELATLAADLRSLVGEPALAAPWAGARLGRVASALDTIRARYLAQVPAPTRARHEPPDPAATWLTVDFQGWYQVRLATGGDPYDDRRGSSGWQFALPGEPDLDRIIRFQPDGAHLRPAIAPGIQIGVRVTAAADPSGGVAALTGALVELIDEPRFEGHNGVVAADGDEPIVPLHLRIQQGGWVLRRTGADDYVVPYLEQTAIGQARSPDSPLLRVAMQSPVTDQASFATHVTASRARLEAAAVAAQAAGDADAAMVLRTRRALIGSPGWTFFSDVGWRLRLTGTDVEVQVPAGGPAVATDGPWWLELLSTAFDPDSASALVRGVLHVPLTAGAGRPAWRLRIPAAGVGAMPLDAMGVRPGR